MGIRGEPGEAETPTVTIRPTDRLTDRGSQQRRLHRSRCRCRRRQQQQQQQRAATAPRWSVWPRARDV